MTPLHPAIEPDADGRLDVGDGQRVYWEVCGNPAGKPALFLHGGPGSGCSAEQRRFFDPAAYRIVLFDQRGCGRSTPQRRRPGHRPRGQHDVAPGRRHRAAARPPRDRALAGVRHLLGRDARARLRRAHPERVSELVLVCVDADAARGYRLALPRRGAALPGRVGAVPGGRAARRARRRPGRGLPPAARGPRPRRARTGGRRLVGVGAGGDVDRAGSSLARGVALAGLPLRAGSDRHALLPPRRLARGGRAAPRRRQRWRASRASMVHGRLDLGSPLATAWELARAWPDGELVVVGGAGHSATGMADEVVAATSRHAAARR